MSTYISTPDSPDIIEIKVMSDIARSSGEKWDTLPEHTRINVRLLNPSQVLLGGLPADMASIAYTVAYAIGSSYAGTSEVRWNWAGSLQGHYVRFE